MLERRMPWGSLADSNGFWGFLGVALGVLGTFGLGVIKAVSGKEIGFRDDLLRRIKHLEQQMEDQRRSYEAQIMEMRQKHQQAISLIREEYRRERHEGN